MDDFLTRIWHDLGARITGPMSFRLVLQPTIAAILAIKAGLADARLGRPPYFWALFTDRAGRRERLLDGWHAVAKVFCLAVILDTVYQFIVLRWVYPGETLFVAFVLACVPYLMLRGTVNRIATRRRMPAPVVRP
jgi:hypothetical protein